MTNAMTGAMIPGWLLHGDLPPTGNRIVLANANELPPEFPGYSAQWLQSGTAALALALLVARSRNPDVAAPSVLLPAYGCPDLIAAAEYAGVRPRLVDIGNDDPGYDLDQLAQALDDSTVAVVAVNFLGIRERLAELRSMLRSYPRALLVEDNAQWFPEPIAAPELQGDLVCLSFGRGKPVSLLGGGALLVRSDLVADLSEDVSADVGAAAVTGLGLRVKVAVFNALLHPRLYELVNRNPLVELGQTRFKPLPTLKALDTFRLGSLSAAATHYLALSRAAEQEWSRTLADIACLQAIDVAPMRQGRLLRYPVLCRDAGERDRLWSILNRAGLGVTAMYRGALPEVHGVAGKFELFRDYANARRFAARLLTLPVHAKVRSADISRARDLLMC